MDKVCCITGHRPQGFPWEYEEKNPIYVQYRKTLYDCVERLIGEGFTTFLSGGAQGVDLDFAEAVLSFRACYPHVRLELAIPCPNQESKWRREEKIRYKKILSVADRVVYVSPHYTPYCMQKRNMYMVDRSDLVLVFWNGCAGGGTYNTMTYAERQRKERRIFYLEKFMQPTESEKKSDTSNPEKDQGEQIDGEGLHPLMQNED
jgi:uncharacterized phage-like protein YoqJ